MEEKNKNIKDNNYALLSKQLFFFFLIVSGNYIGNLLSCNIQYKFMTNRYTTHILGLMTMYFFVTFVDEDKFQNPTIAILTAMGLYLWFIIISLTAHKYTMMIIILIFSIYISNNIFDYYLKKEENKIKFEYLNKIKYYLQSGLLIISIIVTFYSFLIYLSKKKIEYGKKFRYSTFFFGVPQCHFNDMGRRKPLSELQYLKKLIQ
tara:strand:+ start:520 stop:1134 length:615 start_codon:yes stop_codon:yes gene_type:complete